MIIKLDIDKELERICDEMNKWSEINKNLNYVIPTYEVKRREIILILQQILYNIEDAKKAGDKDRKYFNLSRYYLLKSTENSFSNEKSNRENT